MTRTARKNRRTAKAGLARLSKRVTDLLLLYVAVGRLTPRLRREAIRLKRDIDTWRAQTGRNDIRATELEPARRRRSTRRARPLVNGQAWCNCPPIEISLGRLCFLTDCDPKIHWCHYTCIERGPTNGTNIFNRKRKKSPR